MLEVLEKLKAMKKWSDRLGSDEIAEINECISLLEKELVNNRKLIAEINKVLEQ